MMNLALKITFIHACNWFFFHVPLYLTT
jgi:hypothetical protein